MRIFMPVAAVAFLCIPAIGAMPQQREIGTGDPPQWAYPVNPPDDRPPQDDGTPKHVPGSAKALTQTQALDAFNVPDWHPDEHAPMPEVVEHGRKPELRACGYCHLPNGLGRPENASLASLPADYIFRQIDDFRDGDRKSAQSKMAPPAAMITVAKNATDAEVKQAADYFSSLKLKPWIRVVETNTVPKTRASGSMLVPLASGGKEPIGHRIIETAEDVPRTELRDAASGFVAYVPVGSIKKGETLVTSGGAGKTTPCGICHGADLKGLGPVPPLAGRSPSYIFRQLNDIQHGTRKGPWTELMKEPVSRLTEDDMLAIAAYTASRVP